MGLNLKNSGTGIADAAANPISSGFLGQTYIIIQLPDDQTPPNQNTLVPYGSTWKYLDDGSNQGTAWRATDFNDAGWKSGPAILGYCNPPDRKEATVVNSGPSNKSYITSYFRKAITLSAAYTSFTGKIKRDDGVVVYVNGLEVYRNNLPQGNIGYLTSASYANDNGTQALTFTIPGAAFTSGINVVAVEIHQVSSTSSDMTFDLEITGQGPATDPGDQTPPTVLSVNRHTPATETTSATSVTFQATFSEDVTGVDAGDFELAGSSSGTIATVTAVNATTYDVTVNGISGNGTLGLNVKSTGTGIADAAANPLSGGFTGQAYTILQLHTSPGFASVTDLTPLPSRAGATRDKHQAKVFTYADQHWAVIAKTGGTYLWRLDGTSWTQLLQLTPRNTRSDAIVNGDLVHILMYNGDNATAPLSQFRTLQYVPATNTYQPWSANPALIDIVLDAGIETASLALDGTGHLWIANTGVSDVYVRSSISPYATWSGPVTIATGVDQDDIAAAVYIPTQQKLGVFWSNQHTERFGFKTHQDGDPADIWSADEVPGAAVAVDGDGGGMADDHMNFKVGSDGTLYAAVKTSYDDEPEIGLLVRRPNGVWDPAFYPVAIEGTLPIVVLNESIGRIRVVYTTVTNGGDIAYQESALSPISFGAPIVLIPGLNNNVTSTHQNFETDIVILASDETQVVGVLASDRLAHSPIAGMRKAQEDTSRLTQASLTKDLQAYPNPFSTKATLSFALPAGGTYTLTLYDSKRMDMVYQHQGEAKAGTVTQVEVAGERLSRGLYFARLRSKEGTKTLRLILDK
jgi:hypothetical protein